MPKKEFKIEKHFSRLITNVASNESPKFETNVTPSKLSEIIKSAVKLEKLGQNEEALSWYNKVLKIDPKNVSIMYKKALMLAKIGMYEQAIFWFDQIIEIDPTHTSSLISRKIILDKIGKHYGIVPLTQKQFL